MALRFASACLAAASSILLYFAGPARADDFDTQVSAAFAPVVKEFDIPGLVVGVTRNGEHRFYATGLASREDGRPVTPDTLFELGSISKIFTATLAALAEGRGKLRLDDTVAQHVCAGACRIGDDLTLMDLATHHSGGLPLQVPDDVSDVPSLVSWLTQWKPAHPGARSYSN
ncbi:serine hydrolase, partial [Nostoc sp. NIES-2111]